MHTPNSKPTLAAWSRSMLSHLIPAGHTARENGKAIGNSDPVLSGLRFPHDPRGQNAKINPSPNTPNCPPVPPKDNSSLLGSFPSKGSRKNTTKAHSQGVPTTTITPGEVSSPRAPLVHKIGGDLPTEMRTQEFSHRPSLRRKPHVYQFPPPDSSESSRSSGDLSSSEHSNRNEVLSLYPGLPTVLCLDGSDCLVSIVKLLPEYQRSDTQSSDVAIVKSLGETNHRVVFIGENAFLVEILSSITGPQRPTSSSQTTQTGPTPIQPWETHHPSPKPHGNPYDFNIGSIPTEEILSDLDSDTADSHAPLMIKRSKGKQGVPRVSATSSIDHHRSQQTTESSHSTGGATVSRTPSQNHHFKDKNIQLKSVPRLVIPDPGINSFSSSHPSRSHHTIDRKSLRAPFVTESFGGILINYPATEDIIKDVDRHYYPESSRQATQSRIGAEQSPEGVLNMFSNRTMKRRSASSPHSGEHSRI